MNSIIKILLESTIILTAFYAIYLAFHANDKNFRFTRIYLISSSFLAIILPQMNIPIISEGSVARLTPVFIHDAVQLPEIIISDADPGITSAGVIFSPANIILSVYLIGFSYFLVKFLYEIFTLLFFIRNNKDKVEQKSFYKIVKTGGRIPTSSFFNYLFWDETMKFSQKEKEQIMRHEEGHISQFHSYDILYLELLRIVFWFNPFIHSYRRAIATVHEYLADAYVMDQNRDHQYLGLLARQVLRSCHLSLNNHFSKSQTIKRIKMINSDHRRSPLLRWGMSLAIVGIMFYFFACETNDTFNGINSVAKKFPHIGNTEIIIPAEIETASYRETVQEWIVKNTDRSHVIISSPAPQETLNRIFSAGDWEITSHYIDENAGSSRLYAIVCYEPGYRLRDPDREGNSIAGETANMDNNFMKADQQPIPQGGMETFFHYIMNNLKYPEESRVQGIEGKVFVEFVVTKTGDVDQVKVIRGLNIACDEEAKRVVNQSPDWTPGYKDGQPVDVRMVLPITFQLNEKLN